MCKSMWSVIVVCVLLISLVPGPAALAKDPTPLEEALAGKFKGTTVNVKGIYDDSWGDDYRDTLKSFEDQTGIKVMYSYTDEGGDFLAGEIEAGRGPDVMDFSYLSPVRRFAKAGKIVDLAKVVDIDTLRSRYGQNWLDAATVDSPNGPIIGGLWSDFFLESLVWYPKAAFDKAGYKVPATWAELLALSDQIVKDGGKPWCVENGFNGSNPGYGIANWLDNMLLRTGTAADYEKWRNGELPADSPQVRKALQAIADVWFKDGYVLGGRKGINGTTMYDVARPMFATPTKCWLLMEGNDTLDWDQMTDYTVFKSKEYGKDYDFFVLPPMDKASGAPLVTEGHITTMLHDRPEVRAFMEWLTTGKQAEQWVKLGHHAGFSPNKDAQLDWYTNARDRKLAEIAADAQKAGNLYSNTGVSMPSSVMGAVWQALTNYVGGADLDIALKQIDAARAAAQAPGPTATP